MPTIVAGIDGTGSNSWRRPDGANSHVYRFLADVSNDASGNGGNPRSESNPAGYWHGPGNLGLDMGPILIAVTNWILDQMERMMQTRGIHQEQITVGIVGHSRGAAAAIGIANRLESNSMGFFARRKLVKPPVKIAYVGLYDIVDRSLFTGQDVTMKNVGDYRHARRKNRSWNGTRSTFGTVDTPKAKTEDFDTAHGGIGGDPGYFTDLSAVTADFYCNALQLILTQQELAQKYGYITARGIAIRPRYSPLTGDEAEAQRRRVRKSVQEVIAADTYIRAGASAAGLTLSSPPSALKQYGVSEEQLWNRLRSLIHT